MRYLAVVLSNTPLVLDALLLDELLGREDSLRELLRLEPLLALLVGHHLQHSRGYTRRKIKEIRNSFSDPADVSRDNKARVHSH